MSASDAEVETLTVTVPRAREITGFGNTTIWRLIKEGRLVAIRVPGIDRTLITYDSLKALLAGAEKAGYNPLGRGVHRYKRRGRPAEAPAEATS